MPRLSVFNNISLDGYFCGPGGDLQWAHSGPPDPEFNAFVAGNASGEARLLFGRITYELMAGYWPTPAARQNDPAVAEGMNRMPKTVFSRTLNTAAWANTSLVKTDLVSKVERLKNDGREELVILGSGSIVAQLAAAELIDEYQLVVNPVVVGSGRTLFEGLPGPVPLKLTESRTFPSGKVFLRYLAAR